MKQHLLRALLVVGGITVLVLAFLAYLQPAFILDLANRLFLCL
jgi:hypothetical protein